MDPATPKLSRLVLRLVRSDLAEFVAGDLEEEYRARLRRQGSAAAWVWHVGQAIRAAIALPRGVERPRWSVRQGGEAMKRLLQDIRHGARLLRKSPTYTIVVVVTLALAIGANSVIFSFANVLLIKPLPVADPNTLAWPMTLDPQRSMRRGPFSHPEFDDLRRSSQSFVTLSASTTDFVTLTGRGDAQRLQAQKVSVTLVETWGLKPVLGRLFLPEDDVAGAPCTVVLSHKFWKAQFQSDPTILARPLTIDGRPCPVAGVMTPAIEFGSLSLSDVWMPIAVNAAEARRDDRRYRLVGRLRPGVTHALAETDLKAIMARLEREHPETNRNWTVHVARTKEAIGGGDAWIILGLLGLVVGFVLLIACANLANLALARIASRRRELAVRTALGATRWRITCQLVTESLLLGVAGGLAGLAVAETALRAIRTAAFEPIFELIVVDRNVMLFGAALSILSPILFTLLPALYAYDRGVGDTLKDGARSSAGIRARRSRHALLVAQVSLAQTLLVVATLVVRSMIALNHVDPGFDAEPLLVAQIELPRWKYRSDDSLTRIQEDVLARLRHLPGVEGAAAATALPALARGSRVAFDIAGRSSGTGSDRPWARRVAATDDFFRTTGIPVLSGRDFQRGDRAESPPVAILSREAARRYWGSLSAAVGARISPAPASATESRIWLTIVGVVGDTADRDAEVAPEPGVYLPAAQQPSRSMGLVVRTSRGAEAASSIHAAIREVDADIPVGRLRTMRVALDNEQASANIIAAMFAAFAVLALVLASTGLYAVIAYSVGQRTQEIGVRIALGASPADIPRLIVSEGVRLVGIGGAIGLLGALLVSWMVRAIFYGVSPSDPATYAGVVAVVVISSGLAMWLPARRAARIDPVTSLRAE